jgi:hypothetical protein
MIGDFGGRPWSPGLYTSIPGPGVSTVASARIADGEGGGRRQAIEPEEGHGLSVVFYGVPMDV